MADPTLSELGYKLDSIIKYVDYDSSGYKAQAKYHYENVDWHRARRDDFKKVFTALEKLTTKIDLLLGECFKVSGYTSTGEVIYSRAETSSYSRAEAAMTGKAPEIPNGVSLASLDERIKLLENQSSTVFDLIARVVELEGLGPPGECDEYGLPIIEGDDDDD